MLNVKRLTLPMRPKLSTSLLSLLISLAACSQNVTSPMVKCHTWDKLEKAQIRLAIEQMPDDSILIAVLEDYQRVCITLK